MYIIIKPLSVELAEDYFDFFDYRAFSDNSPYYPCYCNAFNALDFTGPIRLYEKLGFVPVEKHGKMLIMRKKLK